MHEISYGIRIPGARSLNEKLLDAEKNLADRDRDLTQFIETRHGDEFWFRYAALVSDVVAIVLDTNGTGTDSKYRIHRLLLDYMLDLTEYPRAACRWIE